MSGLKMFCYESEDKKKVVAELYQQESEEWHRKIHKNEGTCSENVESTVETINDDYSFFVVEKDNELVGFFAKFNGAELPILDGFHIAKKFRQKETLIEFWDLVKGIFGETIYCGLLSKNIPAIKHLEKQGFQKFSETDGNIFIYKLN